MVELPLLTEEGKLLDESSSDLSCQTVLCESTTNTVHKVEYLVVEKEDSKYNTVATLVMGSCFSLGVNCQFKTRQDTLCLVKCWFFLYNSVEQIFLVLFFSGWKCWASAALCTAVQHQPLVPTSRTVQGFPFLSLLCNPEVTQ